MWKLQDVTDPQTLTTSLSMLPSMEKAGSVPHKAPSNVLKVTWNPSVEQLATYDDQKLVLWQLAEGQPKVNDRMSSLNVYQSPCLARRQQVNLVCVVAFVRC